jgi:hypothetical protein
VDIKTSEPDYAAMAERFNEIISSHIIACWVEASEMAQRGTATTLSPSFVFGVTLNRLFAVALAHGVGARALVRETVTSLAMQNDVIAADIASDRRRERRADRYNAHVKEVLT